MDPLTQHEALVGVALCAAYADGAMSAAEDEELAADLATCRALRGCEEAEIRAAMMKADRILSKEGEAALLTRASAALAPELRATAFYLGTDLVLVDDEAATEERAFVERLRQRLGIEASLAQRIVDVILIRNRA